MNGFKKYVKNTCYGTKYFFLKNTRILALCQCLKYDIHTFMPAILVFILFSCINCIPLCFLDGYIHSPLKIIFSYFITDMVLIIPIFLGGLFSRIYLISFYVIAVVVTSANLINMYLFGQPLEGQVFEALEVVDSVEVIAFMQRCWQERAMMLVLIGLIIPLPFLIIALRRKIVFKKYYLMLAFLLLLPFTADVGRQVMLKNYQDQPLFMFKKHYLTLMIDQYYKFRVWGKRIQETQLQIRLPDNIAIKAPGSTPLFGVIILGESHSRHHMSLYGYGRKTTPNLDAMQDQLLVYSDIISKFPMTGQALQYSLTIQSPGTNCSIVDFCEPLNINTLLISNQHKLGVADSVFSAVIRNIKTKYFLNRSFHKSYYERIKYDEAILPVLDDVLKKVSTPTLIVIHLYGCHADYFARYPKTFAKFDNLTDSANQQLPNYAANIVNQYDNAMLYSDMIISQVIKKTESTGKSAFVVFFSDHGEPVYEDGKTAFRSVGVANRYMYDIPLVIWLSSEYKKLFPEFSASLKMTTERPYQMDSFMYAILELMQITYDGFPAENSLLNQRFIPRERIIAGQNYDVLFPHVPKPLFTNNNSSSGQIKSGKSGNKI